MAVHNYKPLPTKLQKGDHDKGTPRSIEDFDFQIYTTAMGPKQDIQVTDFKTKEVALTADIDNDPRSPQSTIRDRDDEQTYGQTSKVYDGNQFTSSVIEIGRWAESLLPGNTYVSTVKDLRDVGSPSWNESVNYIDLMIGRGKHKDVHTTDERGRTIPVAGQSTVRYNALTQKYEVARAPVQCQAIKRSKRTVYGPWDDTQINLVHDEEPDSKIVRIKRNRYKYIAPIGTALKGSLSKHKYLEKLIKPFYKVPFITVPDLNSGFEVTVGENNEHMLLETNSDYFRWGQLIGRPQSHAEAYDGKFKYDLIAKCALWETLQMPNPFYWKALLLDKKFHGRTTGFRELRHALNRLSVLKEALIKGENEYFARVKVKDELITPDLKYDFIIGSPAEEYYFLNLAELHDDEKSQEKLTEKLEDINIFYSRLVEGADFSVANEGKIDVSNLLPEKYLGTFGQKDDDYYFKPKKYGSSKYVPDKIFKMMKSYLEPGKHKVSKYIPDKMRKMLDKELEYKVNLEGTALSSVPDDKRLQEVVRNEMNTCDIEESNPELFELIKKAGYVLDSRGRLSAATMREHPVGVIDVENGRGYFRPVKSGISKHLPRWMRPKDADLGRIEQNEGALNLYTNEKKVGTIVLKRLFDDSEATFDKDETFNRFVDGKLVKDTRKVKKVDTGKVKCEYSANLLLGEEYKENGPAIMNGMLTLLAELQNKLRFGYEELEKYDINHLPTNLDDSLDMITTIHLNRIENGIGKSIDEDLTPRKIALALKDALNYDVPPEFKKYVFWDAGDADAEMHGQVTLGEFILRDNIDGNGSMTEEELVAS